MNLLRLQITDNKHSDKSNKIGLSCYFSYIYKSIITNFLNNFNINIQIIYKNAA